MTELLWLLAFKRIVLVTDLSDVCVEVCYYSMIIMIKQRLRLDTRASLLFTEPNGFLQLY